MNHSVVNMFVKTLQKLTIEPKGDSSSFQKLLDINKLLVFPIEFLTIIKSILNCK